jgi:hypothetical protein
MAKSIWRDDYDPTVPTAVCVSYDWKTGAKTADLFAGDDCIEKAASYPDDMDVRKDWPNASWGVIANAAAGPVTRTQTLQAMLDALDGRDLELAADMSILFLSVTKAVEEIARGDLEGAWAALKIAEMAWPKGALALNMQRLQDLRGEAEEAYA